VGFETQSNGDIKTWTLRGRHAILQLVVADYLLPMMSKRSFHLSKSPRNLEKWIDLVWMLDVNNLNTTEVNS
jgi:hypothetical protein